MPEYVVNGAGMHCMGSLAPVSVNIIPVQLLSVCAEVEVKE